MLSQTIEATYKNGKISLSQEIKANEAKLYILVIEQEIIDLKPIIGSENFLGTELHKRGLDLISKI